MLRYRSFRNTDPPTVTAIWRSRVGQDGLLQPVSVDLLEQLLFGKLCFDYKGMILAWDGDRPVGFAHAGFGPNEARNWISTEVGVTCIVVVRPECEQSEVVAGLLEQSENYLRRSGAKVLIGGAIRPMSPFYLGLYGGAELPGVLRSDTVAQSLYRSQGYEESDRTLVFRRELAGFRPLVDRVQVRLRRMMSLQSIIDAPTRDWWDALTTGDFDLTRFELHPRGSESLLGSVTVRSMDSVGLTGPTRSAGVLELHVDPAQRHQGLATFLMGEAFSELARQGYSVVEGQVNASNTAALGLLQKLGFEQVDEGIVFRKAV